MKLPKAEEGEVENFWPEFRFPEIPQNNALFETLKSFACGLPTKTEGLLEAVLLPRSPTEEQGVQAFDFVVRIIQRRTATTVLFTVKFYPSGEIKIEDDEEKIHCFRTPRQLKRYLYKVAQNSDTHARIWRLMLFAKE